MVCSGHDESVPTYFNPCHTHPSGTLSCGEKVGVINRSGDMMRVRAANGFPRFVSSSAISQRPDQMVPFGEDSAVPDHGAFNCAQTPSDPRQYRQKEESILRPRAFNLRHSFTLPFVRPSAITLNNRGDSTEILRSRPA